MKQLQRFYRARHSVRRVSPSVSQFNDKYAALDETTTHTFLCELIILSTQV